MEMKKKKKEKIATWCFDLMFSSILQVRHSLLIYIAREPVSYQEMYKTHFYTFKFNRLNELKKITGA